MSSPILPVQSPARQLSLSVPRGGPPPEVLDLILAAGEVAEELRESGFELRFLAAPRGGRTGIELHDAAGNTVSTLSTAEAVELAVAWPFE